MFEFYLNNTRVPEPIDLKDYKEVILRDYDIRGLLSRQPLTLTFNGLGFTILHALRYSGLYCQNVSLVIKYGCAGATPITKFTGLIGIQNIEFNLNKCQANCKIDDNSYSAMIFNNKALSATINVGKSKNGVTITPCPNKHITFRDCQDATTPPAPLAGYSELYDIADVFEFLLRFMTDGAVGFVSDWYTNLPTAERISIGTGLEIRTQGHIQGGVPVISFDDLFNEINKKYKLFFSIETDSSGNINMRIEDENYFFKSGIVASFPNCMDLIESTEFTQLYSEINLGSNTVAGFQAGKWDLPQIRYITYQNENYNIEGTCNINRVLNTVSEWIIDSNIIQGLTQTDTANTAYDDNIVIVQYDSAINITPMWNDIFPTPPWFFNEQLTNDNVAARWNVQGDLSMYASNVDETFRASRTSASAVQAGNYSEAPVAYPDDFTAPNFNNGSAYSNATYKFTASAQGAYGFHALQRFNFTRVTNTGTFPFLFSVVISFRKYDSLNNLIDTFFQVLFVDASGTYDVQASHLFGMDTGDYIVIQVQGVDSAAETISWNFDIVGYFECNFSLNGGTVFANNDPALYRILKYSFPRPISDATWKAMQTDPSLAITFGVNGANKKGWISKIERDIIKGGASIEIITDYQNSKS